jgi:hypothetical protein
VVLTFVALRRVPREQWLTLPQPYLLAAGLVPLGWYAAFPMHTMTHSLFMVRPLALNVALAAIAGVMLPARQTRQVSEASSTEARDAAAPAPVSR